MKAKHDKVAMEFFNGSDCEPRELIERMLVRHSMTLEELTNAVDEFLENDVEGAAIAIAAISSTYPNHEGVEYYDACNRILDQTCPFLRLQLRDEFPPQFQSSADEMSYIIFDAAERHVAGFPLPT
jgi:hypothetical protein